MRAWLPLWLFLAASLVVLLRIWADSCRVCRYRRSRRSGNGIQRRIWSVAWIALHVGPFVPVLIACLLLLRPAGQLRLPIGRRAELPGPGPQEVAPPSRVPMLAIHGADPADTRVRDWRKAAAEAGFRVELNSDPAFVPGSANPPPGVLLYPRGRSDTEALDNRLEASRMRAALRDGNGRAPSLAPWPGLSNCTLLVAGVADEPRLSVACDAGFLSRGAPIVVEALNTSLLRLAYAFRDVGSRRRLPSCGVVRFGHEDLRPRAEALALLLRDDVGLTNISVADGAEAGIDDLAVNLEWTTNGRFIAFGWKLLDRIEDAVDAPEQISPLFRDGAWPDFDSVLRRYGGGGAPVLRQEEDFQTDWLRRWRGAYALAVTLGAPAANHAGQPNPENADETVVLLCEESDDRWSVTGVLPEPAEGGAP